MFVKWKSENIQDKIYSTLTAKKKYWMSTRFNTRKIKYQSDTRVTSNKEKNKERASEREGMSGRGLQAILVAEAALTFSLQFGLFICNTEKKC